MGKHSAGNDATVHPLVADALARRAGAPAGAHGEHSGSSTGWPGPPPSGGEPIGWPEDAGTRRDTAVEGEQSRTVAPGPTAGGPRRGWRRLFGATSAA